MSYSCDVFHILVQLGANVLYHTAIQCGARCRKRGFISTASENFALIF